MLFKKLNLIDKLSVLNTNVLHTRAINR